MRYTNLYYITLRYKYYPFNDSVKTVHTVTMQEPTILGGSCRK